VTSVTSCWWLTTTRVTPQSSPCAARVRSLRPSRFRPLRSKMGLLSAALAWSWTSLVRPWSMRLPPIFCGSLR
ncbi:unnamed protein product, partial [Closterium sp. NIES-54]